MCGVSGFINFNNNDIDYSLISRSMNNELMKRGPDDNGSWIDKKEGVLLNHTRLSIVDLTEKGRQPMESFSGRYIICFNGEIYNHKEIRNNLNYSNWYGNSDTETILTSIEIKGIYSTLESLTGMFVIVLWDKIEKVLFIIRDRLGEKPIYYGFQRGNFIFSSDLSAIKKHPDFENDINWDTALDFICRGYIKDPNSIYQNIYKLLPGHILKLKDKNIEIKEYWSIYNIYKNTVNSFSGNLNDASEELEHKFKSTLNNQYSSEVPIGVFLSGGVDSSYILALLSKLGNNVNTYTLGFNENKYNEATKAKRVSNIFNSNHHEYYINSNDFINNIPYLSEVYSEPFADQSAIATCILSKKASESTKVALTGDGADELFAGYQRYKKIISINKFINLLPNNILKYIPYNYLNNTILSKFSQLIQNHTNGSLYNKYILHWDNNDSIFNKDLSNSISNKSQLYTNNFSDNILITDLLDYLPNNILVKSDRSSMHYGLELRSPFLDHNIVEFSLTLPTCMKINLNNKKIILKNVLKKYLPNDIINQRKKGLGIPLDLWLRNDLKDWVEDLTNPTDLKNNPLFDFKSVNKYINNYVNYKTNSHNKIFPILIFQDWYLKNKI
jgi:asparagine synthase (glutamine-hydrolysing)